MVEVVDADVVDVVATVDVVDVEVVEVVGAVEEVKVVEVEVVVDVVGAVEDVEVVEVDVVDVLLVVVVGTTLQWRKCEPAVAQPLQKSAVGMQTPSRRSRPPCRRSPPAAADWVGALIVPKSGPSVLESIPAESWKFPSPNRS